MPELSLEKPGRAAEATDHSVHCAPRLTLAQAIAGQLPDTNETDDTPFDIAFGLDHEPQAGSRPTPFG